MKISRENLKNAMLENGISARKLSMKLNLSYSTVLSWVRGEHGISRNNLCAVANLLHVDIKYLTDGKRVKLKKHETVEYALNILRLNGYKGVIE